jgi:hypothetical protein
MQKPLTIGIGETMGKLSLTLSALVILWCPFSTTAQVDFSSIDAFLKSTLKAEDRLSFEAKGDLNDAGWKIGQG